MVEKATVMFFHSPFCSHCGPAKKMVERVKKKRDDFELHQFNTNTDLGVKKATEIKIVSTPTFIINGPGYHENIGLKGSQSEEVLNKYIDIALGIKKLEEPKSLLERLRSLVKN